MLTRQTQPLMRAPCLFSTYRYQECKFLDLPQLGLCYVLQCGGKVTTLLRKNGLLIFVFQNDKLLSKFSVQRVQCITSSSPRQPLLNSTPATKKISSRGGNRSRDSITHKEAAGGTNRTPCTVLRCVSEGMYDYLISVSLYKKIFFERVSESNIHIPIKVVLLLSRYKNK